MDPRNVLALRGTVVDPDGVAIAGARVEVLHPTGTVQAATTTDAAGAFAFEPVPSFCSIVHAAAPGRRSKLVTVDRPESWSTWEHQKIPLRIVLERGVVAVARAVWDDGTPCAGVEVRVASTSSACYWPEIADCGDWPAPRTNGEGRVVLRGLPANRVLGFAAAVYAAKDEDRLRLFESGSATTEAEAIEQRFTYAREAKLTVVLHGLDALEDRENPVSVSLRPERHGALRNNSAIPPQPCVFEHVLLGGVYSIRIETPAAAAALLARRLAIVELDQHVEFDCVTKPPSAPAPEPSGALLCFRLRDADGSSVTERQLIDRAMWPCNVRLVYGSRAAGDGRVDATTLTMAPDLRLGDGLCARAWLGAALPLWAEATLGDSRMQVDVDAATSGDVELRFDFARFAARSAEVTFRGRDATGRERPLEAVTISDAETLSERSAFGAASGEPRFRLPPGRWRFRATTMGDRQAASDSFEVRGTDPQIVDVALLDCGAIRGRVAIVPDTPADAWTNEIVRSPADGVRTSFDWWKGEVVGGDGDFEMLAVPPGEWPVTLKSTAPDGARVRCESATVSVAPGAIARVDFPPTGARTTEYRFDLGNVAVAVVHVTDGSGRTCLDGFVTPRMRIEIGGDDLRFRAAPGRFDRGYAAFEQLQWTEGVVEAGRPPLLVRFAFPAR